MGPFTRLSGATLIPPSQTLFPFRYLQLVSPPHLFLYLTQPSRDHRQIKPSSTVCLTAYDFSCLWTPFKIIVNIQYWHLVSDDLEATVVQILLEGKRPRRMLFLYFPKSLAHVGHTSSNTELINGREALIRPTVYTSKNWELPFVFVMLDQSLLPALPNYRKNSIWSRKLVLWIHISFVGQCSGCIWHDFCWYTVYSLFSFFFSGSEKDYFHSSHKWWKVVVVSLWPWASHLATFSCCLLFYSFSSSSVQQLYDFVASHISSSRFASVTKGKIP